MGRARPPCLRRVVLYSSLNIVATFLADPSNGTEEVMAAAAENPTVALNPFGVMLTLLTWASLLGINAWCFWRILRQSQETP